MFPFFIISVLSLNRVASHSQATSGVQPPEAMTRGRAAKRNQEETSGRDGGEYVMGFWIPKSKRQQAASQPRLSQSGKLQWSPLAPDELHLSPEPFTSGLDNSDWHPLDKRFNPYRYVRRRVCDFTRLTANHILEYLKTGRICGRRVSNVRFALTGRK